MEAHFSAELWIVDHQDFWRTLSVDALRSAGFFIQDYKEYSEVLSASYNSKPDLVLLGCITSQAEERDLLQKLARRGWLVVVFASSLSVADLRDFFHAGAVNVVERPRSAEELLSVVCADLASRRESMPGQLFGEL